MLRRRVLMGSKRVGVPPAINLSLTDIDGTTISNTGTYGAGWDGYIVDKSTDNSGYVSGESGLTLTDNAYAVVDFGVDPAHSFTICIRGKFHERTGEYAYMLFRANSGIPSVYYFDENGEIYFYASIAGTIDGVKILSHKASTVEFNNTCIRLNNDYITVSDEHTFVYIGDVDTGLIYFYVDGELIAQQDMSKLESAYPFTLGSQYDEERGGTITISDVRMWDCAMDIKAI